MRAPSLSLLLLCVATTPLFAAEVPRMLLVARDTKEKPLAGFRFAYEGVKSLATSESGATELDLPPKHEPGQKLKLLLLSSPEPEEEWFLVDPMVNVPVATVSAELVLMKRGEFRDLAAEARDATSGFEAGRVEPTEEDRKRVLIEVATGFGLTAEQLEAAIRSFAETGNLKDQGIAAYLEGELSRAEGLLKEAVRKQKGDLVETLRYLGLAEYQQYKHLEAAETFRKAMSIGGENADFLGLLGESLLRAERYSEAEPVLRTALRLAEELEDPAHSLVGRYLFDLGSLLQLTLRTGEAEPLMRQAVAIREAAYGTESCGLSPSLSMLALIVDDANPGEAEILLRRALRIDVACHGPDRFIVGVRMERLATQLEANGRAAEAESLLYQALPILSATAGPESPYTKRLRERLERLGRQLSSPPPQPPLHSPPPAGAEPPAPPRSCWRSGP